MSNPFDGAMKSLSGPATDIAPVTPSDTVDLPKVALSLYIETGGMLSLVTEAGTARTVKVADFSILPVGTRRVNASGTTASGVHALTI